MTVELSVRSREGARLQVNVTERVCGAGRSQVTSRPVFVHLPVNMDRDPAPEEKTDKNSGRAAAHSNVNVDSAVSGAGSLALTKETEAGSCSLGGRREGPGHSGRELQAGVRPVPCTRQGVPEVRLVVTGGKRQADPSQEREHVLGAMLSR